jgi:hypothetical protein
MLICRDDASGDFRSWDKRKQRLNLVAARDHQQVQKIQSRRAYLNSDVIQTSQII